MEGQWCVLLFILCSLHRQSLVFADGDTGGARRHQRDVSNAVNCTFDSGVCNWKQDSSDTFDWTRQRGGTPSDDTGPQKDHTTGSGYYMYTEATSKSRGAVARLMSPDIAQGAYCLQFMYSMRGRNMGTLNVKTKKPHEMTTVWTKNKDLGPGWSFQFLDINESTTFKLVFEGIRGSDYQSDIAIDDVSITVGKCLQNQQFNCTFDIFSCGWTDLPADIQWIKYRGSTTTSATGPRRDHTSGSGSYMYIEGTGTSPGVKAKLLSPEVPPGGERCLQFFYHMYGQHMGNLTVLLNKTEPIWIRNGSHSNAWERGLVTLNETSSPFTVVFQAVRGSDYLSDIAIDDIFIFDSQCPDATDDFNCTFEDGICGWEQDFEDDFDWNRREADTTGGTDYTTGTAYGHVMNADIPRRNTSGRFISPEVPPGSKCLKFAYKMRGDNLGTLSVLVETDQNMSLTLWSNSANRGNIWRVAYVNITEMFPFKIVFDSWIGNSSTRGTGSDDTAIDDVTLFDHVCPKASNSFNCTFDGEEEECGWIHEDSSDDFDWLLNKGPTSSSGTGPRADHTSGNGSYMYIEVTSKRYGMKAHLVSPEVKATGSMCLEFFYHMFGQRINALNVYIKTEQNRTYPIWQLTGNQGNSWKPGSIAISGFPKFQVIFEGVSGSEYEGDIAVDDVTITEKTCRTMPALFNCTFDANMCGWTGQIWERLASNSSTGNDTSGYGYALGRKHPCASITDYLSSPRVVPKGPHQCIRFYYQTLGKNAELKMHLNATGSHPRPYWTNRGDLSNSSLQGNPWSLAVVQVNSSTPYKVSFEAACLWHRIGAKATVVFLIDDVTIANDTCFKPPPVYNCTFDKDICGWEQDSKDDFDWTRQKGSTPSSDTGPSNDHTLGTRAGYYMYIEATSKSSFSKARLITPEVPKGPKCLQFFYSMRGKDIGSLNIYTTKTGNSRVRAWTKSGNLGPIWKQALVSLNESDAFQVIFEGVRGKDYAGDIAIDDVTIMDANKCPEALNTFNCTFDESECGWTQNSGDDFDWTLHHGSTPTSGTGPSSDHTTGSSGGLYMYIEATSIRSRAYAQLISPAVSTARPACLQFFYHMYGSHMGTLNVYTRSAQNTTSSSLWTRGNNLGNRWRRGLVTINQTSPFKVIMEGVRGNDYEGDLAIDDITISNGTCLNNSAAVNCTFDDDECGWQQTNVNDDFDWTLHKGATPSSGTGPTQDRTPGVGGNYMYIEASNSRTNAKAHLLSSNVNGTGRMCLEFFYHMWGTHIGTLNVYQQLIRGSKDKVWSLSGAQGNYWKRGNAEVNAPVGTTLKLLFEGIRGGDYAGDISIDDITLSKRPCAPGLVTVSPTTTSASSTRGRTFPSTMPSRRPTRCEATRSKDGSLGVLSSNPYLRVLSCSWTIMVQSGSTINLHVRWEAVDNALCAYRTLVVYEKEMTEIGTFCGNETTWDIRSKDNVLRITYDQNIPTRYPVKGFTASWIAVSGGNVVRGPKSRSSDWVPHVVGVTLFLVLVVIVAMVVIAFLYKRKYACFSKKSDDPQLIDLTDIKEDGSFFGGGSYSRLRESTGTIDSGYRTPEQRKEESVREFKEYLHAQGVTESTYHTLAKEGFRLPKMFELLKPEDVSSLPIKQFAQVLLVKEITKDFHNQQGALAGLDGTPDRDTHRKEPDNNDNQKSTGL
ncbi:MAM and LDL-receptor class A domain-containing protein 1-like isoform X2 [Lineus longissimus]|uniref:MAM and LDL-receptor class A domain-containing protein 1-like isoform X2 n=1 Tax=Lineus longissimus TaxID=88925 RepID=UPI002B4D80F7